MDPWESKTLLSYLYHSHLKTATQIADELGCSQATILRRMDKFGIDKRDKHRRKAVSHHSKEVYHKLTDKDWLQEQYHDKHKSANQISKELGVTNQTVLNWMENLGLEIRPRYNFGENNPEWKGDELNHACEWCGDDFRSTNNSPNRFCSVECLSEWRSKAYRKENNWNWRGGYEGYYGVGWQESRKEALERDGYECQECGMTQEEHKRKWDKSLHVHHKTPRRQFESYEEANKLQNLETLCTSCHRTKEMEINVNSNT